jgi:quercetin dioxygenase-like cupin family protein
MRKILLCSVVAVTTIVTGAMAQGAKAPGHVLLEPAQMKWGPPPPVFEQNAKFAVVSGDPSKPGIYVVRFELPGGYKIAPHWHPTDEHVTVLSGTLAVGMGDTFDKESMKNLSKDGYALLPAEMRHYALAKTAVMIEVYGMGPFVINYVNPADDPSKRAAPKK